VRVGGFVAAVPVMVLLVTDDPFSRSVVRAEEKGREGRLRPASGSRERLRPCAGCGIAGGGPSVVRAGCERRGDYGWE
jgi:hypothetical protein